MIKIIESCYNIGNTLHELSCEKHILDYRVFLRKNESVYVYVLIEEDVDVEDVGPKIHEILKSCNVDLLTKEQVEGDSFYGNIFSHNKEDKVVLSYGRRRYNSVWDTINSKKEMNKECPVVSFYSYKGGMGRTTTLACFASYLAIHHGLKVVIIDCDLEAPGFTNYFLLKVGENNQKNGLIEYIFDKGSKQIDSSDIRNYLWEVDHLFSNDGSIYVMPSGNLAVEEIADGELTDMDHYVEGISRLDLSNSQFAESIFSSVITDVRKEIEPDVILLDSKTGISDLMGITICALADKAVGFFRGDVQSLPGLHFFVKSMMNRKCVEPFIVNSILPNGHKGKKLFESFKKSVEEICDGINPESDMLFLSYPLFRVEEFSLLGTQEEDPNMFVDIITDGLEKDYLALFEDIYKSICGNKESTDTIITNQCKQIQKSILDKSYTTLKGINLYADETNISEDLMNGVFYFRRCMGDLLNMDKILIIGSKGTGKSYLYNALKSDVVVERIKQNTSKKGNFLFVYAIDRSNRILHADKIDGEVNPAAKYRYWLIYTWNAIASDIKKHLPQFEINTNLLKFVPDDTDKSRRILQELIQNEEYIDMLEAEFARLNDYVKSLDEPTFINIIYDQLDEIVQPRDWNKWIPDLIKYWRMKRFSHISGKLFMRTDLFRQLDGVNNINELANAAINIEWSKEEIFSYFFQLIIKEGANDLFWNIMDLYNDFDASAIETCKNEFSKSLNSLSPLTSTTLIPMAYTYFGEYVDTENTNRMGNSFDWFYRNLKNADNTISLRPFISLVKSAIEKKCSEKWGNDIFKPILFQKCYTDRTVRYQSVKDHYDDMIKDMIGSQPVQYTFDYISNVKEMRFKRISQREDIFDELLLRVITKYGSKQGMADITVDKLKKLLIDNGIVGLKNYGRGNIYVFSFLYKYNLGLRGS